MIDHYDNRLNPLNIIPGCKFTLSSVHAISSYAERRRLKRDDLPEEERRDEL